MQEQGVGAVVPAVAAQAQEEPIQARAVEISEIARREEMGITICTTNYAF